MRNCYSLEGCGEDFPGKEPLEKWFGRNRVEGSLGLREQRMQGGALSKHRGPELECTWRIWRTRSGKRGGSERSEGPAGRAWEATARRADGSGKIFWGQGLTASCGHTVGCCHHHPPPLFFPGPEFTSHNTRYHWSVRTWFVIPKMQLMVR